MTMEGIDSFNDQQAVIYCDQGTTLASYTVQTSLLRTALPNIPYVKETIEENLPISFDCLVEGNIIVEMIKRNETFAYVYNHL